MTKKIFGVLGLGIFGRTVVEELNKFEQEVIALDRYENLVQNVADMATKAAVGDMTDIEFLKAVGIAQCDVVVIATGNTLESSVLAIMHCKKLGVKTILAKAKMQLMKKCFTALGRLKLSHQNATLEKELLQICFDTILKILFTSRIILL